MSIFTIVVLLGIFLIIGGISLAATPLITFMSAGYFIIVLFFIWGIAGIIRGVREKRYDKDFFFAILSLILAIVGFATPGAAALNSSMLIYMAAFWFLLHGVLSIINAIRTYKEGAGTAVVVIGVILGVLELILFGYSMAHPAVLAVSIGVLIGFYFIESGLNLILIGSVACKGGNNLTILFTIMGVLMIIGGFCMIATPLTSFFSVGHCIIMLLFINGVLGIVRAILNKRYDREFFFSILSLILGIIGFSVPGLAERGSLAMLYIAAAWFILRGVLSIIAALDNKKKGAGTAVVVIGIILGVLELIIGILSAAHPAVLAIGLGIFIGLSFIESGFNLIFTGSAVSSAVAISRDL